MKRLIEYCIKVSVPFCTVKSSVTHRSCLRFSMALEFHKLHALYADEILADVNNSCMV